jgi:hypothetical protein
LRAGAIRDHWAKIRTGVDAVLRPLRDRPIGQRAAGQQDPIIGDPDLAGGGVRRRGEGAERERCEQRNEATHRLLNASPRRELRPVPESGVHGVGLGP